MTTTTYTITRITSGGVDGGEVWGRNGAAEGIIGTRRSIQGSVGEEVEVEAEYHLGEQVEGGDTDEDRDTGTVIALAGGPSGERVTVAWSAGVRTTVPTDTLRRA